MRIDRCLSISPLLLRFEAVAALTSERDEANQMLDAARTHQQTIEQQVVELEKEKVERCVESLLFEKRLFQTAEMQSSLGFSSSALRQKVWRTR